MFNSTPDPNIYLYTSIMNSHALHGLNQDALTFYIRMLDHGISPNEFAFSSVLKSCFLEHGRILHSQIIKHGFDSDLYVRTGRNRVLEREIFDVEKDYASENEVLRQKLGKNLRRGRREKLGEKNRVRSGGGGGYGNYGGSFSGESEGGGSSTGLVVITRPKGGSRSLCMDLDEVKACRDLGFELEHERMMEIPSHVSTFDTSSGGNSPISNWRISSPGDDPRDVKARLKVWAQAVALASTSRQN